MQTEEQNEPLTPRSAPSTSRHRPDDSDQKEQTTPIIYDIKWLRNHPTDQILGDLSEGVRTKNQLEHSAMFACYLSQVEPDTVESALQDPNWIIAMQEELNGFERNRVWELVPRSTHQGVIRTNGCSKTN